MNARTHKQGFTIIEVVLVLAIAALIFLMIFVALPALQRGQRDTARKQDANTVASALSTFRSNNRGVLPTAGGNGNKTFNAFKTNYLKNLAQIDVANVALGDNTPEQDNINVILGEGCDGKPQTRTAAVWVGLESTTDAVCTDA